MLTSLDIKEPGISALPLGVERHVVNGGGLTGIQILPDDEIEIVNDLPKADSHTSCDIVTSPILIDS